MPKGGNRRKSRRRIARAQIESRQRSGAVQHIDPVGRAIDCGRAGDAVAAVAPTRRVRPAERLGPNRRPCGVVYGVEITAFIRRVHYSGDEVAVGELYIRGEERLRVADVAEFERVLQLEVLDAARCQDRFIGIVAPALRAKAERPPVDAAGRVRRRLRNLREAPERNRWLTAGRNYRCAGDQREYAQGWRLEHPALLLVRPLLSAAVPQNPRCAQDRDSAAGAFDARFEGRALFAGASAVAAMAFAVVFHRMAAARAIRRADLAALDASRCAIHAGAYTPIRLTGLHAVNTVRHDTRQAAPGSAAGRSGRRIRRRAREQTQAPACTLSGQL